MYHTFGDLDLATLKTKQVRFTPPINSTLTVQTAFHGIKFDLRSIVSDLKDNLDEQVIMIQSNHGKAVHPSYPKPKEKSTKGRKCKPKPVKTRIVQGDGSSFGSTANITVRVNADWYPEDCRQRLGQEYQLYKFKLFTNGVVSIPGVLLQDLSDARYVIDIVTAFLAKSGKYTVNRVEDLSIIMMDFKFCLDLPPFDVCIEEDKGNIVNLDNIKTLWVQRNADVIHCSVPCLIGYIVENKTMSRQSILSYVGNFEGEKTYKVHKDMLVNSLLSAPVATAIKRYNEYIHTLCNHIGNQSKLSTAMGALLANYILSDPLAKMLNSLAKNTQPFTVEYNNDGYQGLIISISTPTPTKPEKQTKLKLFSSGKINIDGAISFQQAEFIYYWLNNNFLENWDNYVIWHNDPKILLPDPDYSSDDSCFDM